MKSRAARALVLILGLVALGAAGYKIWDIEQRIGAGRAANAVLEARARQIVAGLAELGSAQQAYVAVGQGEDFWFQKVSSLLETIGTELTALRQLTQTPEAGGALESVTEQLASFAQLDQRARDLIKSGQRLSGSDLVFTEGAQSVSRISLLVNEAHAKEAAARSAAEAVRKRTEAYLAGGAAIVTLLALILLVPIPRTRSGVSDEAGATDLGAGLGLSRMAPAPARAGATEGAPAAFADLAIHAASPATSLDLGAAARLCTSLARVREMAELPGLLEQAARLMDASGLIVWIAETPGGDLRPAVAHGYDAAVLARLGVIQAGADNATATAYRTGTIQAVSGDPLSNGALVVPLSTSVGVAGALAAELRHGRENDESIQSMASIVAAQLSTLFTPAAEARP